MATRNAAQTHPAQALAPESTTEYPADRLRFDWQIALASLWILAGTFLDGWYHNTFQDTIETFFTPWHGVLYSGLAAAGAVLLLTCTRNLGQGYPWQRALPKGYLLSLLGFVIFTLGGGLDFAWHAVFGFEANEEALLSPAHLLLVSGGVLLTSGPLRAAWGRATPAFQTGWAQLLPALVSLLTVLSFFTFFTQYANAFTHANIIGGSGPVGESYFWNTTGIASVLMPAGLITGFSLLALRRWRLPVGSLTLLLATNAALMFSLGMSSSGQHWPVVLAALAGGVLADVLLVVLKPSVKRARALRLFSFGLPFSFFLLYFIALLLSSGVWWRIHMWLGVPFLAGVVGLGLSYVLVPPTIPSERAL